jgi:ribosomal protein L11 methyltransferase
VSDKSWFAVEVSAAPEAAEAVEHCLNELDALGTEIDQLRKKASEDVTVIGYFDSPVSIDDVRGQLDRVLDAFDLDVSLIRSVSQRKVDDADWLAEWKKHWRPTRVGRFVIAPSWFELKGTEPGTIVIRIEPNMAFGTGTHETTKLCLKAIDAMYQPEMSFLDVGTGTGILAIAAAKMRGMSNAFTRESQLADSENQNILAIETDADSVAIARENSTANGVENKIDFVHGTLSEDVQQFDLVCANVTLDVISPMLALLLDKSRKYLVLSGILAEQETQILDQLKSFGVNDTSVERDGEWMAVIIKR